MAGAVVYGDGHGPGHRGGCWGANDGIWARRVDFESVRKPGD